jgi:hypothetical protein
MTFSPRAIEAAADFLRSSLDDDYWREGRAEEFANGALTAALAVDGVALVPKEPTEAMIIAGCENNPTQWNEGTDLGFAADVANDVYRAMLAAASDREERRPPPKEKP